MPGKLVFVVLLVALAGAPRESHAEKGTTNQPTEILNRKGEAGRVLTRIKSGQKVTILGKDGRWLKVRANGRTGWVPRSKIDVPDDTEISRNTRRRPFVDGRSTARNGLGGNSPDDRVGADATEDTELKSGGSRDDDDDEGDDDEGDEPEERGSKTSGTPKTSSKGDDDEDEGGDDDDEPSGDVSEDEGDDEADDRPRGRVTKKVAVLDEPDPDSDEAFVATKSTTLYVGEKKGKYTFVENDEGDGGYVLTSALEVEEVESGDGDDDGVIARPKGRQINVRGRAGVSILQQGLRSDGVKKIPDNYNLSTSAATLSLGGGVLFPYSTNFVLGGEIAYDYAKALPGITYMEKTTGITVHNINVRAIGGYALKKKSGMTVLGRLGYRYQAYRVSNATDLASNTARLPQENFKGPTIGAGLSLPMLTDKIGARVSLDTMLFATKLAQTKNLEDGGSPKAKAACLGLGFSYRWKPSMDIQATYDLNYLKANFGTPTATSQRGHMGTGNVSRTDFTHAITVGVGMAF